MSDLFANNPYYVEYETRLKQLSRLMAEGKSDTDEAEAVRDAMDTPWMRLTQAEQARLNGLSADLYMLEDDEVFEPADGRTKIQIGQSIFAAMKQEKWEEALALMRKPNLLPRARIAAFRAVAYDALGHVDTALLFIQYVMKLDAQHPVPKAGELAMLRRAGRLSEGLQRALSYLDASDTPAFLRIYAASIVVLSGEDFMMVDYNYLISTLKYALDLERPTSQLRRDMMGFGYEMLGYCYIKNDKLQEAYDAFKEASRFDTPEASECLHQIFPQISSDVAGSISATENLKAWELKAQERLTSMGQRELAAA